MTFDFGTAAYGDLYHISHRPLPAVGCDHHRPQPGVAEGDRRRGRGVEEVERHAAPPDGRSALDDERIERAIIASSE